MICKLLANTLLYLQQFRTTSTVQLKKFGSFNVNAKFFIPALCAFQVRQHNALIDVAYKLL